MLEESLKLADDTIAKLASDTKKRFETVDLKIRDMDGQIGDSKTALSAHAAKLAALEASNVEVLRRLAIAEQPRRTKQDIDADRFDRPSDPEILVISPHPHTTTVSAVVDAMGPFFV